MEKSDYDDQLIVRYLLGSVSEEETERLDGLSIADDEFAARLQVVENDLVDDYVRGDLSDETIERFDSYYLASQKRCEKVAFARGLQSFIDGTVITRETEIRRRDFSGASATGKPARRKSFLHWSFRAPGSALRWGMAAALAVVLIGGGWLMYENLRLRNHIHQVQAEREELQKRERELQSRLAEQSSSDSEKKQELANLREQIARLERQSLEQEGAKPQPPLPAEPNIVSFALAPQMRGVSQPAMISIPSDADYVMMQLDLEPGDIERLRSASYRAELKARPGNEIVWRSGRLRAGARGEGKAVVVTLRPMIFKSQMYTLEVYGVSPTGASEIIGSYPFRVVK